LRIIGIHDSHNAAVALIEDGAVKFAIQEERLARVKNIDCFPERSVKAALKYFGYSAQDIDYIAFNGNHQPFNRTRAELLSAFRSSSTFKATFRGFLRSVGFLNNMHRKRRRTDRVSQLGLVGFPQEKARFVEHHRAHATAAYYGSGWADDGDPVLVLTCDGSGDDLCATVSIGKDGKLERIAGLEESHSLGIFYAQVTTVLGMMPNEDEHKVMGMAPYASKKHDHRLKCLFSFPTTESLFWQRAQGVPNAYHSHRFVRDLLEHERFDRTSASIQQLAEDVLAEWVRRAIKRTGIRRLALSGGVFMNVKANKVIAELDEVDQLFIFPSCGDETNTVGAAWACWLDELAARGETGRVTPVADLYWGPGYDVEDVEKALADKPGQGYSVEKPENMAAEVAKLLADGQVVARYYGRMEFGARALGNRSILADPRDYTVVNQINEMIKCRDFWMPFAPAVLDRRLDDYIVNPKHIKAPYMILAFDSSERRNEYPAAIQPFDKSARPQEVFREWNPGYYAIIEEFEKLTGRGIILNTSFNLHGHPIVCTPGEALDVFLRSGLNHLILGDYLCHKV